MDYPTKFRRDELRNNMHEMSDSRVVGDMGECVTFGELRALLDIADKIDRELEATQLARDELERLYAKALQDAARWREIAERWYGKAIERAGRSVG